MGLLPECAFQKQTQRYQNKTHRITLQYKWAKDDVDFRNHGDLMLQPEMGVKIPLSEKSDLLTVAYRYQRIKTTVTPASGQRYIWEYKANMNRLSFGVAIMFR